MKAKFNKQILTAFLVLVFLNTNAQNKGEEILKKIESATDIENKIKTIFSKRNKDTTNRTSDAIKILEQKKLIKKYTNSNDSRSYTIQLTKAGSIEGKGTKFYITI